MVVDVLKRYFANLLDTGFTAQWKKSWIGLKKGTLLGRRLFA